MANVLWGLHRISTNYGLGILNWNSWGNVRHCNGAVSNPTARIATTQSHFFQRLFFRWCGTQCGELEGAGSIRPPPGAFWSNSLKHLNSFPPQWPKAVHPAHVGPSPDPDNGAGYPEQRQHEHVTGIPDSCFHNPSAGENSFWSPIYLKNRFGEQWR